MTKWVNRVEADLVFSDCDGLVEPSQTANQNTGFYAIDSAEGQWNTGRKTDSVNDRSGKVVEVLNLGYKPRYKEGYFPVAPTDTQQDIRGEMCREMEKVGLRIAAALLERGVIGRAMPQGDILGFAPPLCLTRDEADTIVAATKGAVEAVTGTL